MKLETKFQDKDFELGEVVKAKVTTYYDENKVVVMADRARGGISRFEYSSIKDFTDHWEDAPEKPKGIQWVDVLGANDGRVVIQYSNEEKAKKAVECLRAWQRLEEKGIKFYGWRKNRTGTCEFLARWEEIPPKNSEIIKDLNLLFRG